MKQVRRWQRILFLSLLSASVLAPILFFSYRLQSFAAVGGREFIDDLSNIRYRANDLRLNAIEQEVKGDLRGPKPVYKDEDFNSAIFNIESRNSTQSNNEGYTDFEIESNGTNQESKKELLTIPEIVVSSSHEEEQSKAIQLDNNMQYQPRKEMNTRAQVQKQADEKVKEIRDKIIQAQAYLNFAPPGSNSQLVKELRTRMRELERVVGDAVKDSDLSRSALHKKKPLEASLSKASRVFSDCPGIATKLRAMTYNTEEQVRTQKNQEAYLVQLAARTTPKGLHCLSMRLTSDYFGLDPEKRQLPNQQNLDDPNYHHYAVFSDNVLACAVAINSSMSSAKEPERMVFHVVTDSLNFPAISYWFILNPPGKATIEIQSMDNLNMLPPDYIYLPTKQNSADPRFISALNHLRFYLPVIFPKLNKIILLDHDVVVQKDLSSLWDIDMKGKVIGAVQTCVEGNASFRRMNTLINFSDAWVAKRFDPNTCTWAFGMNLFDLGEWRRTDLTSVYHKYVQLGTKRHLWMAGSLPIGWLTFYNHMLPIDKRWQVLGLGYESGVGENEIEQAAVIHYDGMKKPWLDIGIAKYKGYWTRYVPRHHPHLQQCNIQY